MSTKQSSKSKQSTARKSAKKTTTKTTKTTAQLQDEQDAEKYKKLDQIEHVLKRPDTYVGSIDHNENKVPIFVDGNPDMNIPDRIKSTKITYVPAFYKIFDEVLVNAIDQHTRLHDEWKNTKSKVKREKINRVTKIDINIDKTAGSIEVINNGRGIDIVYIEKEEKYAPGLIFGVLLTGENYDDTKKKTTGGKNGFGAKLANILSNKFIIETVDGKRKKKYKQIFKNNMKHTGKYQIEDNYTGEPFTRVKFYPDFDYFKMDGITDELFSFLKKRAWDTAAWVSSGVKVSFNGELITTNTFKQYATMYIGETKSYAHEVCNERWEIMATYNTNEIFEQYSFVNGINTIRGGRHVDYIVDQICEKMIKEIKKTEKLELKSSYVKNQLMVFVKAIVDNPDFDGQTKETLTSLRKNFGSTCEVSDKFIKDLAKTGIVDRIVEQAQYKERLKLKHTDGKRTTNVRGIDKYTPANKAGTKQSKKCTLILTEGDSAKTLVISGLTAEQRDYFGVFPLKGKLLNVKDKTIDTIAANEEIFKIKQILGLETNKDYSKDYAVWPLRYGKVMIFADQDHDGLHIKGLVMNYFDTFHPGLLKRNDFIVSMLTPIVKIKKGTKVKSFYSQYDYEKWMEANNGGKGWTAKYYKGLGTSNAKEAKEYFTNPKIVQYDWTEEQSAEALDLAFRKARADNRKTWLTNYVPGTVLDQNKKNVTYEEFINKDMIQFSLSSVKRAIPSIVDGHKPSQRKVLYACFKRNLVKEIKVAQLAGYISEHSGYHHGEASLMGAIIKMAQTYVGSNNINLLMPNGQFGTRIQGGEDHASPRYIFTCMNAITKLLYSDFDRPLLNYLEDDGQSIEPEYYVPILPMILINGCQGIATGWSSNVPCYNPIDIGNLIESKLTNKPYPEIKPWYNGFKGTIHKVNETQYMSKGLYQKKGANSIVITELPVGVWTEKYISFLNTLLPEGSIVKMKNTKAKGKGKSGRGKASAKSGKTTKTAGANSKLMKAVASAKSNQIVRDVKDNSTEKDIQITIQFASALTLARMMREKPDKTGVDAIEKYFRLTSNINTSNMMLFDSSGRVKKYKNPYEIMDEFYTVRMDYYKLRKKYMLDHLKKELVLISYKVKFIREILNDTIDLRRKKRAVVDELLEKKGYPKLSNNLDAEEDKYNYDYLVHMRLDTLTYERIQELENNMNEKKALHDELVNKPESRLWVEDLKKFFSYYKKISNQPKTKSTKTTKTTKSTKSTKSTNTKTTNTKTTKKKKK